MTFGQDLDAMIEARNAREWEEQNTFAEIDYAEIDTGLEDALDSLGDTYQAIADAANEAEGSPDAFKIRSLLGDLEVIRDDLISLRAMIQKGAKPA